METVGIVCEYNPLHLGHQKQFELIRRELGEDAGIVCIMSGNFVQRGHPAVFHRSIRAKAAIMAGADLVLQMPVTTSLSSAEGFAAGSVSLVGKFCDRLCFGAEDADEKVLSGLAQGLLSPEFSQVLRQHLDQGLSFPAARQKALEQMGLPGELLAKPNNILAVEYCKAILSQSLTVKPMPIFRGGDYHDTEPDRENPSATFIRQRMAQNGHWQSYVPIQVQDLFATAGRHSLEAGEKAILGKLRTMTEAEFAALPFGSEGLWRKLMHAVRTENSLESIACAVKSKRYTRSRIDRMILCAFLGLTQADLDTPAPYARVLALNEKGGNILKNARKTGFYPNIGEKTGTEYEVIEERCDRLYGLTAVRGVEAAEAEKVSFVR